MGKCLLFLSKVIGVKPACISEVALGVSIDLQDALTHREKRISQGVRGRCLDDPTFFISDGNNSSHKSVFKCLGGMKDPSHREEYVGYRYRHPQPGKKECSRYMVAP